MAWILDGKKLQVTASDGTPLSGATLYCYSAGTTTAKNMYPTIADAAANTNAYTSVVLDSRGEPTSKDLVVIKGTCKLKLADSAGSTIWTIDNMSMEITKLYDTNGNIVVDTTAISNSVNYFSLTNAATTNSPILEVAGNDSNIDINFLTKGTGTYNFKGTSDTQAIIRLYEDTSNGSNYVAVSAPDTVASNITFTLPSTTTATGVLSSTGYVKSVSGVLSIEGFRGCLVYNSADLTAVDATAGYNIPFDSEVYDTDSIHSTVTNTDRLTVPSGVSYVVIKANLDLNLVTTLKYAKCYITKNGSSFTGMAALWIDTTYTTKVVTLQSAVIPVSAGDYFRMELLIETDTSITINKTTNWFAMEIIC